MSPLQPSRVIISFALATMTAFAGQFSVAPATAANSDVPSRLLSARDSACRLRDRLLAAKAEEMRCWNEDEASLRNIAGALRVTNNMAIRQQLLNIQSQHAACVNRHRGTIANIESAVINNDKDLSWLESQITSFACMR